MVLLQEVYWHLVLAPEDFQFIFLLKMKSYSNNHANLVSSSHRLQPMFRETAQPLLLHFPCKDSGFIVA